jgi:hypothetical protein
MDGHPLANEKRSDYRIFGRSTGMPVVVSRGIVATRSFPAEEERRTKDPGTVVASVKRAV